MDFKEKDEQQIFDSCVNDLTRAADGDRQSLRRAVQAMKWLSGRSELLEPLTGLLEGADGEVRIYVVECLGYLKLSACVEPLVRQIEESFVDDGESMVKLRESAIKALGENGHENAVEYLASILYEEEHRGMWSDDERSIAAEALIHFAIGGNMRALEILAGGLKAKDRLVKELSQSAMLVISDRKVWDAKGYHSFPAELERTDSDGPADR